MIGAFVPFDRVVYTAAPASYPTGDIWYVSGDATIVIEFEEVVFEEDERCDNIYNYACSCVVYVREIKGIDFQGDAYTAQPNYFGVPFVGDLAIFHYPDISHLAFVEEVYINGNFKVSEWNYLPGQATTRIIMADDEFLIGFIHQVNQFQ